MPRACRRCSTRGHGGRVGVRLVAAARAVGAGAAVASAAALATAADTGLSRDSGKPRDPLAAYDAYDGLYDRAYGAGARDFYDRDYLGGYGGYGGFGAYGDRGYHDREFNAGLYPERGDRGAGAGQDDDCARIEANGTPLADALREAAAQLGDAPFDGAPASVQQLAAAFVGDSKKFFLSHCPQAVVLAAFLRASHGNASVDEAAIRADAEAIGELLSQASTLRSAWRPPAKWAGPPWEEPLSAAQQRTGIVLFPTGEQVFHIDTVSPSDWRILPRRRCAGRRDLGNLQSTPLEKCLAMCASQPLCRSATFWHWQPGMFGFEKRCFLSSTCTPELATADGAEGAVLFEKRNWDTEALQDERRELSRSLLTPAGGAPWAPRCGHRLLAAVGAEARPRLWLLGGVGVDALTNTSNSGGKAAAADAPGHASSHSSSSGSVKASGSVSGSGSTSGGSVSASASGSGAGKHPRRSAGVAAAKARRDALNATAKAASGGSSVIEAYLSRHVELSGELLPLRSLPYARLGDVWRSDDLGASWTLSTSSAPWGPRAFFEALAVRGGRTLLVLAGVSGTSTPEMLSGVYSSDVWWADLAAASKGTSGGGSDELAWAQLKQAPWAARAHFSAVLCQDNGAELLVVLGGRLAGGSLTNDVWAAQVVAGSGPPISQGSWYQVAPAAAWSAREDFAAAWALGAIWVVGGSDAPGRALSDVWRSQDSGASWELVQPASLFGRRVGLAATALGGVLVVYGGYSYPDDEFGALGGDRGDGPLSAAWFSDDGQRWAPVNATHLSWTMHGSLVAAPCDTEGLGNSHSCAYGAGGLTHEGYYDNSVRRLFAPSDAAAARALATSPAASALASVASNASAEGNEFASTSALPAWVAELWPFRLPLALAGLAAVLSLPGLLWACRQPSGSDAGLRRAVAAVAVAGLLSAAAAVCALGLSTHLARELLRSEAMATAPQRCDVDAGTVASLREALGLGDFETLLRLALREPAFGYGGGYGGYGGFGDYGSRSYGAGAGAGGAGATGAAGFRDPYGFGGSGGGFGGYYGEDAMPSATAAAGAGNPDASLARELAQLPTTQSLSCRTPRCDRNATACASNVARTLSTPYGCCGDYMLLMLGDVTSWLDQQKIPYYVVYGTLLGALRDGDIMPWTQDMDIVVDRAHWPQMQRGLEAAEFFGGRRYFFGVDQWEERVSRVCADWEGFAASVIGGAEGDRYSRATEFHLDVYASDWWQVKDLHLVDCVEPLSSAPPLQIRGRNFSAPAKPRACVEKLYGAEWRTPKRALSGVN